jgi:hypothetical protein
VVVQNTSNNSQNFIETQGDRALYLLWDAGTFVAVLIATLLTLIFYIPLELLRRSHSFVSIRAQQSGVRQ